jgi:hypothetical protein
MSSTKFKKYRDHQMITAIQQEDSSVDDLHEMTMLEIVQNSPMGRLTPTERDAHPFKWGKYAGLTPNQVLEDDPLYIKNVYEITQTSGKVTRISAELYRHAIFAIENAQCEHHTTYGNLYFDDYDQGDFY